MAVTAVKLKDVDAELDESGHTQYTVTYQVETNDKDDLARTAMFAAGIPLRGDTFSLGNDVDPDAWCRRKSARLLKRDDTYKAWHVTCHYSSNWNAGGGTVPSNTQQIESGPLSEPARWSVQHVQFTKDYHEDRSGNKITNSAGDPFTDPPIVGDDSRMAIIVEKNFLFVDVKSFAKYYDALNFATHWTFGPRRLKISSITAEQRYYLGQAYAVGRMEVHVQSGSTSNTWDRTVLDAGYYDLDGDLIKGKDGLPVTTPYPLDGFGAPLPSTDTVTAVRSANIYRTETFSAIGFPNVLGAPF